MTSPPQPPALPSPARKKSGSRFEATSWGGALIIMTVLCALLWAVQIISDAGNLRLTQYGLRPRDIDGLEGIVTTPFLHSGYGHLLANTAPFIFIGWVVLLSGVKPFLLSSAIIIVIGDLITWLIAPSGLIVGASGLVLGWLGYLLGRAYFSRRFVWIVVAIFALFFFGTLLGGLLPSVGAETSWQGHVAGFVAGVFAAWVLHPRGERGTTRARGPAGTSQPLSS